MKLKLDEGVTLYRGDCLEVMPRLKKGSVDLVLCDLPYGSIACKWDAIIPFDAMWENLYRLTKQRSAMCFTATQPFTTALAASNLEDLKYDWVWLKSRSTDFLRAKLKPMGKHESVLVFSKVSCANGALENMDYYPQGLVEVNKVQSNSSKNSIGNSVIGGRNLENYGPNNVLHNPTYVQKYQGYPNTQLNYKSAMKCVHPTQKPVALMEYIIKTYTKEGDTVLDFTMGSGTTGVACVNTGRKFIGIEKDDPKKGAEFFQVAVDRITEALLTDL